MQICMIPVLYHILYSASILVWFGSCEQRSQFNNRNGKKYSHEKCVDRLYILVNKPNNTIAFTWRSGGSIVKRKIPCHKGARKKNNKKHHC